MFDIAILSIAFCAGMLGCLIGGTLAFITTGVAGLFVVLIEALGIHSALLSDLFLNTLLLPCVIFTGAAIGTAYASKKHLPIRGVETGKSLAGFADPSVLIAGGIAGLAGYLIYAGATMIGLPTDCGAFSIIVVGIIGRLLFNKEQNYNQLGIDFLKKPHIKFWAFQLLSALAISFVTAYFALYSGLYTVAFYISAASLIFALTDPAFPTTHHITLVAGYAIMQTGNILLAVVAAMIAQVIFIVFGMILNTDCGTHIDPPAVAICIMSFILFAFF